MMTAYVKGVRAGSGALLSARTRGIYSVIMKIFILFLAVGLVMIAGICIVTKGVPLVHEQRSSVIETSIIEASIESALSVGGWKVTHQYIVEEHSDISLDGVKESSQIFGESPQGSEKVLITHFQIMNQEAFLKSLDTAPVITMGSRNGYLVSANGLFPGSAFILAGQKEVIALQIGLQTAKHYAPWSGSPSETIIRLIERLPVK